MHWIVIVQMVASALYVAYLIYWYSLKSVGIFVKVSVYFTWLICFSNVVLLPFDIYYSLQEDYAMGVVWKVSYALIFFLTWLLLPIAQEYEEAGEFTIAGKLKRAIINNLIIYGIFVAVGVLGLGYLMIAKKVDLANLLPVLLAASNAFGMFLVVIFLAYGLTAIPRNMWRYQNYKLKLKKYQFDASSLNKKKGAIQDQLELQVKQILWKIKKEGDSVESMQILNLVPGPYVQNWSKKVPDLGEVNVVNVHKKIKQLTLELSRIESRWQEITISAFKLEDILTYMNAPRRRIESTIFNQYKYEFLNYLQWMWQCRLKVCLVPLLAVVFSLFTLTIVIAELAVFMPVLGFLNPYSHLTKIGQFVWLDLVLLLVLGYMAFCIYFAMFKLKLSNLYGLHWNKQTDAASLIFFAINCSRITNPLNYNFLQVIHHSKTSFEKAMGETPLIGKTLQVVFPILIIILVISNVFDVYSRICKRIGLKRFQFESEFSHENIEEGRKLLQKARMDLETKILNSNCKNLAEFRSYKSDHAIKAPEMSRESSSSEAIHLKPQFFNEFRDMQKVAHILEM